MIKKLGYLLFLLRTKGVAYTFNYIHFKLFYYTEKPFLSRLLHWLDPYPPYVEIETTTACNLKCLICEHTYWKEKSLNMSFEQFKKILDQFPGLKWIGLTGIGESFLNKDFMKILELVKSRNIYIEMFDTFYFVDEKNAEKLVDLEVDKIIPSIDGATAETYNKIRVGSDFDKITKNVKALIDHKKRKKAHFPELDFHFIINKLNVHEISQYVDYVHDLTGGAAQIYFTRLLHNFPEVQDLYCDQIPQELVDEANSKAAKYGMRIKWNINLRTEKPSTSLCTAWVMPFIFVTGEVICCCATNEGNARDLQKKYSFGNVFEKPFKEIWSLSRYRNFRKALYRHQVPIQCRNCCNYGGK
ncbi:MAG: radical SAM protein [Candidatus Margulisbacteria bacterium]|nr:radical SAM protein [Candidatus Margulisiibacteriota bacterium]